ncbi:hypothetical protein D3C77_750510 [compost metagenome]
MLPAGNKIEVCKVKFNPGLGNFDDYLAGILYLEIDYESAYREKCEMYKSRQEGQV